MMFHSREVEIYSTSSAFLALKPGSGQCWGKTTDGGDCSGAPWTHLTGVYEEILRPIYLDHILEIIFENIEWK